MSSTRVFLLLVLMSVALMADAAKTYYEILGLDSSATQKDVKQAFRKMARHTHPDHHGKQEEFIKLRTAFETLSDVNKRTAYDMFLWRHNNHHHDDWDSGAFTQWQETMISLGLDDMHWFLQIVCLLFYLAFASLVFGAILTLLKPIFSAFASISFYIVLASSIYSATVGRKK